METPLVRVTMARGLCGKPLAADRSGLGCSRFQHHLPTPKDACGQHSVSRHEGPAAPADRHRAGKRHRFERTGEGHQGPLSAASCGRACRATEGEGEWNARKHGGLKRRVWRKIHIGIDEQTLEIRAVEITGSNTGDAPMLPHLLNQIPRDQHIGSVTADGAYDTRRCHNAIHCPAVHVYMHERG